MKLVELTGLSHGKAVFVNPTLVEMVNGENCGSGSRLFFSGDDDGIPVAQAPDEVMRWFAGTAVVNAALAYDEAVPLAPVPTSKDEFILEALRLVERVSAALNALGMTCLRRLDDGYADPTVETIEEIARRRFSDLSGLHLFIGARKLEIELPPDLTYEREDDDEG